MTSMSISPSGQMYGLGNSGDNLYRIDVSTGELTLVGEVSALVRAIEFGPDGTLYAAFATLFELNPIDGSTIREIGRLGASGTYVAELNFSQNGLQGVYPDSDTTSSQLYNIDLNGTPGSLATPLAHFPNEIIWSIASIPEPSTSLLTSLAIIAGLLRRGRR